MPERQGQPNHPQAFIEANEKEECNLCGERSAVLANDHVDGMVMAIVLLCDRFPS
jgi:hypothetical protein